MVRMTLDSREVWEDSVAIGTYDIDVGPIAGYPGATAHIMFVCPNGHRCGVLLGPTFVDRPTPDGLCIWGWNGDRECPTLVPSINCISEKDGKPTGGCGWHGHITNGVMQ